jgi:hypothetical protein
MEVESKKKTLIWKTEERFQEHGEKEVVQRK